MSQPAHNQVCRGVCPLGVRPQEFFALTTDEHRWTQIFRGVAKLCPSRRGGNPLAGHFVCPRNGFIICVDLCESVVKKFPAASPENPSNSFTKICENPSKTPHRQASSSLIFFGPRPPLPAPHPRSSIYGLPLPNLCATVPLWFDIPAFSRAFLLPNSCLRAFV